MLRVQWGIVMAAFGCMGWILACQKQTAHSNPTASGGRPTSSPSKINQQFLKKDLDVASWKQRFERHNREVWRARNEIVGALQVKQGQHIADIGAGTGAFLPPFLSHIGTKGILYAVEISPAFVRYLQTLAMQKKWSQVKVVHSTDTSTRLPDRSVDIAFTCDTYHHFDNYPQMLADIRRILRPNGRFVVVDFQRIPGVSDAWILNHVKHGKSTVIQQITQHGFVLQREVKLPQLKENYMLIFGLRPNKPQ